MHSETDGGPKIDGGQQTVMDAHRRWATVKNERVGIVLEVTHRLLMMAPRKRGTNKKRGMERVCKMNLANRVSEESFTLRSRAISVVTCEQTGPSLKGLTQAGERQKGLERRRANMC